MKKKHKKSRWKFIEEHMSPLIVVFSIVTVLVFSVVVILLSLQGIELSSTLIEYFYKFFGFEMLALSGIKISKHIGSAFGKIEEVVDGVDLGDDTEDEVVIAKEE